MCYQRIYEYEITPEESYSILRNCSICGCKSIFINTNHFRVNANGNKIDVWLIYQCSKCKHTFNLTIYERQNADQFSPSQYQGFMNNEKVLAKKYGTDKSYFLKNKAEIDWSCVKYQLVNTNSLQSSAEETNLLHPGDILHIENPSGLKVRNDKIIAELFHITRNAAKRLEESGSINIVRNNLGLSIHILSSIDAT